MTAAFKMFVFKQRGSATGERLRAVHPGAAADAEQGGGTDAGAFTVRKGGAAPPGLL